MPYSRRAPRIGSRRGRRHRLRTGVTLFATTALAATVWCVIPSTPAGAGCSARSTRDISGTLKGSDGLFVNATVSLALSTAAGQLIDNNGCAIHAGYAQQDNLNPSSPADGSQTGESAWRFDDVPANAAHFTIEIYPRQPSPYASNWDHYGGASVRADLGNGVSGITAKLPSVCGRNGGDTGGLHVRAYSNGQAVTVTSVLALSQGAGPTGVQGFRYDTPNATAPNVDAIASAQRYSVPVTFAGTSRSVYDVPVHPCRRTDLIVWSGSRPPIPGRWRASSASISGNYFPIVGDFNGDGKDDTFFYGPGAVTDSLWLATDGGFRTVAADQSGNFRPAAGDFNGDGIEDIFWFAPGAAADQLWTFDARAGHTVTAERVSGTSATWPRSGDFDGNGFADIVWYTSGGATSMWRFFADGPRSSSLTAPGAGFSVLAGDVDGNFKDDLFWYSPSTGSWRVYFGLGQGQFLVRSGSYAAGAHPVMGDFSGDYRADVLMYEPGSGSDFLLRGRSRTSPYFSQESTSQGINGTYCRRT